MLRTTTFAVRSPRPAFAFVRFVPRTCFFYGPSRREPFLVEPCLPEPVLRIHIDIEPANIAFNPTRPSFDAHRDGVDAIRRAHPTI